MPGAHDQARARIAAEQAAQRQRDRRVLVIGAVAFVLVLAGAGIGFQAWRSHRAPSASPVAGSATAAPMVVTNGQPLRLGGATAPAGVTLYEDFHCPHCADFEDEFGPTLTAAQNAGVASVDLYPMAFIDRGSFAASNAMACAAEAGFGQPYYLGLFANHTLQWSDQQLVALATTVGATATPTFTTCVTDQGKKAWVDSINAAAGANGVTGTPTLFLNGAPVDLTSLTPASLATMISKPPPGETPTVQKSTNPTPTASPSQ